MSPFPAIIPRLFLILMFNGLFFYFLPAQTPHINRIRFTLPQAEPVFTRGIQDSRGYLWLASDHGLFRFDGISFKRFQVASDSVSTRITALHESPDGTIWIGCSDGRIFSLRGLEARIFNPEEGTAGTAVTDIITDHNGVLWWSTAGEGIYYYFEGRVYNINHEDGLNEDYVYDLECDRQGTIRAGTDAGVAACRLENGKKVIQWPEAGLILPDIIVRVVKEDDEGNLWLGFQDGGAGFIPPGKSDFISAGRERSWDSGPVRDIVILKDEAWIATVSGNISEVSISGYIPGISDLIGENGPKIGKINDLLPDREGNVWILSHSGLFRTTGSRLRFLDRDFGILLSNIHSVLYDRVENDKLWVSNDRGLYRLDLSDGKARRYLENFSRPDVKITCLYQDRQGFLWAGTFNYGIFRIDPSNGSWKQITETGGLINNNVLSISGHEDTLWMATLGGASEVILNGRIAGADPVMKSHNSSNGLVSNYIYSVFEDKNDRVWFATDGDGIIVRTKNGWITYNEKSGLGDDVFYSVAGDKFGNIWLASAGKGIYKFDGKEFSHFGADEGLMNTEITGITASVDELIIIHNDGMAILHIPTNRVVNYGEETGLGGISPDLNSFTTDARGNVWIGSAKGIFRYQASTDDGSYSSLTILEEMSVYLEPRNMINDLALGYRDNHISFKYTGLWFSHPDKVVYQVFLEGYDLGWKDTYDRQTTYSNLPPGKYTFRVRSSLDPTFRNSSEASFGFSIKKPFWMNTWFILIMVLLLIAVVMILVRKREKRLKRIEQQKKEKVEFEFQVLKNQVNPHFLFNSFSTLMALIEEQPGLALEYTEKLSDFFRIILQFKEQDVITLDEEISLVENYVFLLEKRYGENLEVLISLETGVLNTLIPPMTLQILIENAVKHNVISKDMPLKIGIKNEGGKIIVENNLQPKKTAEISTGIGLENVRKRYRLVTDKEPLVERTGLYFRVILPLIESR